MAYLMQFIKHGKVSLLLPQAPSSTRYVEIGKDAHLQKEIRCVVETQHQSPNPHHVIHVRECDESNCSQMVDEHDQEVLETGKKTQ